MYDIAFRLVKKQQNLRKHMAKNQLLSWKDLQCWDAKESFTNVLQFWMPTSFYPEQKCKNRLETFYMNKSILKTKD